MGIFADRLSGAAQLNHSRLCVGLDPEFQEFLLRPAGDVFDRNRILIDATADLACAYKPNLAIYESLGGEGITALERTLEHIRQVSPAVPIIGDAKRGDIGSCSAAYVKTMLDHYEFDGVTVNPYMGYDSLEPFLNRAEKGIFILCRTSNPSGRDLQELMVVREGDVHPRPLYEVVAELARGWDSHGNVGLVVGATNPQQIRRIRELCPSMVLLIPGIGSQGGDLEKSVAAGMDYSGERFLISVSRQIMNAAKTPRGALRSVSAAQKNVRLVARRLRDEINRAMDTALVDSDPVADSMRMAVPG